MPSVPPHPPATRGTPKTWRERLTALAHVPAFLREVFRVHRGLALTSVGVRLVRALLPVATLYVGKLIIDEVLALLGGGPLPAELSAALVSPQLRLLWGLLAIVPYLLAALLAMYGVISSFGTALVVLDTPMAIQEMVLAVWLIAKGFSDPLPAAAGHD